MNQSVTTVSQVLPYLKEEICFLVQNNGSSMVGMKDMKNVDFSASSYFILPTQLVRWFACLTLTRGSRFIAQLGHGCLKKLFLVKWNLSYITEFQI